MKVMIATGGTGGHIYPALAFAEILKNKDPSSEVIFFGSSNRMEATLIPQAGYVFYGLDMKSTDGGFLKSFLSAVSLLKAYVRAHIILKKEKPDICIGFGNYISVPLILAARHMRIPTMLHEQNSFTGKANRFLSKYVNAVVGCYESNRSQMPQANIRILGNPEATFVKDTIFDSVLLENIGLKPDVPFVVFMMGSLGSASVSKVIDDALSLFDDTYQIVIVSGKSNTYQFKTSESSRIKFVAYIDGKQALKGCTLAVTRAGATTIAELCALPCAAILIPSPYVPNNHQLFNAMELVEKDAAVMLEEKNLTAESLARTVNLLMRDSDRRNQLCENALRLANHDAAEQMIEWIEEIIIHG